MEIKGLHILPEPIINKPAGNTPAGQKNQSIKESTAFQEILSRELAGDSKIKVSVHAQRRLAERNIVLGRQDWEKINHAVNKAQAKGASNSLVIHGDTALIVSVKNRTVISAMDENDMREHIFTNIDSAVIIK
ncbi:TIGR02530 family flagellar biosynthesis protein [Desulfallas thermosapovorans]|uniref:Flagellar operon protein n=1 Tax=Desulfallas thermosapovorans DSM 6562 TaxID=1121431 RepID=A0A5S4ZTR1_9FIRM|nr:TIGR02530 family flagellar biosynthesis protein [Desulfallas thermosapovorans]TYO95480.1 flagellar operon protein [Desulfallas thermosapovorans DSM 6562]